MKKNKLPKKEGKKNKGIVWKLVLSIGLIGAIVIISVGLLFALYIVLTSPDFEKDKLYQKEPTILYDVYGKEFARVGAVNSTVVTYDEIPEVLVDALLATEDSRFFQHNGLDLFRFLKASVLQLMGKTDAGGASTLSMQVIKRTYTGDDSNTSDNAHSIDGIIRKFKDIYMSVFKLEANYTKEEIIEFYFNSQWFANDGSINVNGIVGIEEASIYFFGKSCKDLNLAEASMLVGMFQNTAWYSPYTNPEGVKIRQQTVLKLMVRHGYINEEEANDALAIPIEQLVINHGERVVKAGTEQAFIDYVIDEVSNDLGVNPKKTSLKIYTTFDPTIQSYLEQVEKGEIFEYPDEVVQEGIAITSTENGSIVAMSGGRNYAPTGTNRATGIERQPGSTAKPLFDYAMYIENIAQSTYSMLLDEHTTYTNGQPINNYDNGYKGLVTMRFALKDSRNIPALRVFKKVAALDQSIIENFIHSVGIDYGEYLYESASIGGLNPGVSPLEMSAAYASFGRGGYYIKPYAYTKVENTENGREYVNNYRKEKVMEESTAYLINNLLISSYGGTGVSGTDVAGKTGTTNLDSDTKKKWNLPGGAVGDSWYLSYSPSYCIALWYGYDEFDSNSAALKHYMNSTTSGNARRKIINGIAPKIHVKNQRFKVPKSVVQVNVESETFPAYLCSEFTPKDMCLSEYFVAGTEPTEVSSRYSRLDNPTNGSYSVTGSTINIKWDPIKTPDAINTEYLNKFFKDYYEEYADTYYNRRISYNNTYIGNLGYEVYLKDSSGTEKYLGYTSSNSFVYNASSSDNYTFVIKSAYSIFKNNRSTGLTITSRSTSTNNSSSNNNNNNNDDDDLD